MNRFTRDTVFIEIEPKQKKKMNILFANCNFCKTGAMAFDVNGQHCHDLLASTETVLNNKKKIHLHTQNQSKNLSMMTLMKG